MNEHEDRARTVKAAKLRRVCEWMLEERPDLTVGDLRGATPELRDRVARVAGTRTPSDQTWGLVTDQLARDFPRRDTEEHTNA